MQIQRILINFFPQNNITYNNKVSVQELHYYTDDVIVPEKYFLAHNFIFPICHCRFLKTSALVIHGSHRKTPFSHLIASAVDSLSSLIIFSNRDDTTVDSITVNSCSTNMTAGTLNSRSGTDIDS